MFALVLTAFASLSLTTARPSQSDNAFDYYARAIAEVQAATYASVIVWEPYFALPPGSDGRAERIPVDEKSHEQLPFPAGLSAKSTLLEFRRAQIRAAGAPIDYVAAGNQRSRFEMPSFVGIVGNVPQMSGIKGLVRFASALASVQFADGDPIRGTGTLIDTLTMVDRWRNGTVIGSLVATGCRAIVDAEFEREFDRVSAQDCDRIAAYAAKSLPPATDVVDGMEGERRTIEQEMAKASSDRKALADVAGGDLKVFEDAFGKMSDGQVRELIVNVSATLTDQSDRVKQLLSRPEREWFLGGPASGSDLSDAAFGALLDSAGQGDVKTLATAIAHRWRPPDLDRQILSTLAKARTQTRLLRLHALVNRHRWLHGQLPGSLDELRAPDAVADPLAGRAFFYERQGLYGYDIWSDGGTSGLGKIQLRYRRQPGASSVGGENLPPSS